MTEHILVVAAHSDDEALGCGGTIARHVANGDSAFVVYLADGVSARHEAGCEALAERTAASEEARQVLGIERAWALGFPDNRLDTIPLLDVVQALENVLDEVRPHRVYTHHRGDLNVDHRIAHQAVLTACRPLPGASVKAIYGFEVVSATEWNAPGGQAFEPNVFVDITAYVDTKMRALEAYQSEMRPAPHARSMANVRHLMGLRGHSVGVDCAEAFELIRWLES